MLKKLILSACMIAAPVLAQSSGIQEITFYIPTMSLLPGLSTPRMIEVMAGSDSPALVGFRITVNWTDDDGTKHAQSVETSLYHLPGSQYQALIAVQTPNMSSGTGIGEILVEELVSGRSQSFPPQ